MGLDSVELLMSFENYFEIRVTDKEAEKISTVQDMVNCVAKHLNVQNGEAVLKLELFGKLKTILIEMKIANASFSLSDKIFSSLKREDKPTWKSLSEKLDLSIPQPIGETDTFIRKITFTVWPPRYDWKTITVDQFITAVCAKNYEKLIDKKALKSTYEILIAIIAITNDRIGVDLYEIQPEKRFVEDFGID